MMVVERKGVFCSLQTLCSFSLSLVVVGNSTLVKKKIYCVQYDCQLIKNWVLH
jgi:hypothetical protein